MRQKRTFSEHGDDEYLCKLGYRSLHPTRADRAAERGRKHLQSIYAHETNTSFGSGPFRSSAPVPPPASSWSAHASAACDSANSLRSQTTSAATAPHPGTSIMTRHTRTLNYYHPRSPIRRSGIIAVPAQHPQMTPSPNGPDQLRKLVTGRENRHSGLEPTRMTVKVRSRRARWRYPPPLTVISADLPR